MVLGGGSTGTAMTIVLYSFGFLSCQMSTTSILFCFKYPNSDTGSKLCQAGMKSLAKAMKAESCFALVYLFRVVYACRQSWLFGSKPCYEYILLFLHCFRTIS